MTPKRLSYMQRDLDEHSSIAASLEDFEPGAMRSPTFDIPSQHSGFRSEDSEPDSDSAGPWSPPAWHRPGSGWFNREAHSSMNSSPARSRQESPQHDSVKEEDGDEDQEEDTLPAKVPLPESPEKRRTPSPSPQPATVEPKQEVAAVTAATSNPNNYIRFAMRAEVQHRTDSFEAGVTYLRQLVDTVTHSKTSIFFFISLAIAVIAIWNQISQPPNNSPGPDLIKVAGLARSFEPLIHYSEHGAQQIGDLQETGVAVWDLGESVRSSNMTSAPIIVRELDNLSESLKTLAIQLTKFFANVDGDIDSILIVMEWTKRELNQVISQPPGPVQSALENIHQLATKIAGPGVAALFGRPQSQLTRATLHRTFNEFLNVLEESINSELQYSTQLFGLFEAIDQQFLNLQRTVIRETDSQDAEKERKDSELANLWRRMMNSNESRMLKYNRNRQLLASIKERTVANKLILADHNGKLLQLKSNLEILRKRLVSPLVRSNASSSLSVHEQIQGLDGTYEQLKTARDKQKTKLLERLYGAASRRASIGTMVEETAIDSP